MKLLVGMLSCGENERERAIDALKRQSFRNWDFFEIRDRPNKEAHVELYRTFMSSRADCYLKLDADMVLKADVLERLVEQTRVKDVTVVYVDDWPSRMNVPGMQIFSSWCKWEDDGDRLNVDTSPRNRGGQLFARKRWVDHMPDPHDFESFRYGVHKALKVLQPGTAKKKLNKMQMHYTILKSIWKLRRQDPRRALMVLGAECVFSGEHPQLADSYTGDCSRRLFDELKHADVTPYSRYWDSEAAADRRLHALQGSTA